MPPGYGGPAPSQPTQQFPQTQPGPGAPPPPGFPPGPMAGGPGMPPGGPQKSRTGLIVGVIVAAVVVVAGLGVGAYFLFANKTKTAAPETTEQTSTTKGSILSSTTKPKDGVTTTDPLAPLFGGTSSDGTEGLSSDEMSCVESTLQNILSPAEQQDLQSPNTSDATLTKVARAMDSCVSVQSQERFYAKYIKQGLQKSDITVTDKQAECMAQALVSASVSFADFVGGGSTGTQQQIADAASSCGVKAN